MKQWVVLGALLFSTAVLADDIKQKEVIAQKLVANSEEHGYLIKIASTQYGFDELEKIAENLEVEVLDAAAVLEWEMPEVACFDLSRG